MLGSHLSWVDELLLLHLHLGSLRHGHLVLVLHLLLHLLLLHDLWVVAVHHLLLLRHHGHSSEWVHVLRVHHLFSNDVFVHRWHSTIFNEIIHWVKVKALALKSLEELFLLKGPEIALILLRHVSTKAASLRQLRLKGAFLGLSCWVRSNALPTEVVEHLAWYLFKGLFGQLHRIISEVTERHKLHDISCHLLLVDLRVKRSLVSIQLVHG